MAKVVLTLFETVKDHEAHEYQVSFETLPELLRSALAPHKEGLPLLKLARFGDRRNGKGMLRHADNIMSITGVEGDYDGGVVSRAEAASLLRAAGLQAILYDSPSSTPSDPRWRVLCPFFKELPPKRRHRMVSRLNGALGGVLSAESWTLGQCFFYGSVG